MHMKTILHTIDLDYKTEEQCNEHHIMHTVSNAVKAV